jgi:hypothetical protein
VLLLLVLLALSTLMERLLMVMLEAFRGGYSPVDKSIENNSTDYVGLASNTATSGKGRNCRNT